MIQRLRLADAGAARDLRTLLQRASRVDSAGAVRVLAIGPVLTLWVRVLAPAGLLDDTPTVLGMRAARLAEPASVDAVVSLADAIAAQSEQAGSPSDASGSEATFVVPAGRAPAAWTGITPPTAGWTESGTIGAAGISALVERGVSEVAASAPTDAGAPVLAKVRSAVWGRPATEVAGLPAGAGFALAALGFLGTTPVRHLEASGWHRLSTLAGEVLVRPGRRAR